MKDKLKKMLAAKIAQRDTLNASMIESDKKEERAAIGETLKALNEEIADVEAMLADVDAPAEGAGEAASAERKFNPVAALKMEAQKRDADPDNMEYRKAFQQYIATGKMEYRADESTTSADVGVVIPENLVNRIIERMEQVGTIYNLVTKTAFAVGQTIPVDTIKPVATWIGEGASSDSQKKTITASMVFTSNKLRCEIRYSEEVSRMAISAFEALFVKQVSEAMLKAQETAIVEGSGSGQPEGILKKTPVSGQGVTATELDYKALCDTEAALPVAYENGAKWCMTKKTFMGFVGMTDTDGQPIARTNYGIAGKPERSLLGREVVIYEPTSTSLLKTGAGLVAFLFDFGDYVLNTNYDLGISHAKDWDNEDHKTKAVLACDGHPIEINSLVTLTIG